MYVCTSLRHPSHEYAVKVIAKADNHLDEEAFHEEIKILSTIKHTNIIRLKDVYETAAEIFIVTELAYGGELFDRILKTRCFSEKDVVNLSRKLFHAVAHLHSRGIVHRVRPCATLHAHTLSSPHAQAADSHSASVCVPRRCCQFARSQDIKPENVLFASHDADSDIKLSDFGFARNLLTKPRNLRAKTQLGTFGYM